MVVGVLCVEATLRGLSRLLDGYSQTVSGESHYLMDHDMSLRNAYYGGFSVVA